ncbi:DUF2744 domain-containing protein [Nocardia sp. BMG111209]|uniref:phage gene 29 protein family protein n=1 Tax=Nocardia sp. BMG111209 TaxID=1160137 RepID=UPI000367082A|nr:DUF2744 domain-containing protein [Nocardia sp. BMG111209]
MPIPLRENCDPNKPEEAFLWALVGLPGQQRAPLTVHPDVLRKWSKHLWELGFRHYPDLQANEYHPPARGVGQWFEGAGRWLPTGTPRVARSTAPNLTELTAHESALIIEQLRANGDLDHLVDPAELPGNTAAEGTAAPDRDADAEGDAS